MDNTNSDLKDKSIKKPSKRRKDESCDENSILYSRPDKFKKKV